MDRFTSLFKNLAMSVHVSAIQPTGHRIAGRGIEPFEIAGVGIVALAVNLAMDAGDSESALEAVQEGGMLLVRWMEFLQSVGAVDGAV